MTMVKILKSLLAIASLGLCIQSASFAAEPASVASISGAEGTVMVDRGNGFVSAKPGDLLYPNDRVITLDGSLAKITYTDGCSTNLKANNLTVISNCNAAVVDATKVQPGTAVAGTHPASYIPPVVGAFIFLWAISAETNGFGAL
jgi:hypothetical protein